MIISEVRGQFELWLKANEQTRHIPNSRHTILIRPATNQVLYPPNARGV